MVIEEWKNLSFVNCSKYEVSNFGKIRNVQTGKCLTGFLNRKKNPYRQVLLGNDNKETKALRVCRLVAMAFVDNPDPANKIFVDHIDGDSLNDVYTNLRWVTRKENNNNPVTTKKISEALKGKPGHQAWNKGIKTGRWDKPMSDQGKRNIKEGHLRYWQKKREQQI